MMCVHLMLHKDFWNLSLYNSVIVENHTLPGLMHDFHCVWYVDIDECATSSTHMCMGGATCNNIMGSYDCICPAGSQLNSDQRSCSGEPLFLSAKLSCNSIFVFLQFLCLFFLLVFYRNVNYKGFFSSIPYFLKMAHNILTVHLNFSLRPLVLVCEKQGS